MEVVSKQVNSTLYIGLCGELDESKSNLVRSRLDSLIEESKMKRVVFDMSKLKFMDSTGIGVLIGRYKKLRNRNVSCFLAAPSISVDKVLSITGLYSIMPKIDI